MLFFPLLFPQHAIKCIHTSRYFLGNDEQVQTRCHPKTLDPCSIFLFKWVLDHKAEPNFQLYFTFNKRKTFYLNWLFKSSFILSIILKTVCWCSQVIRLRSSPFEQPLIWLCVCNRAGDCGCDHAELITCEEHKLISIPFSEDCGFPFFCVLTS